MIRRNQNGGLTIMDEIVDDETYYIDPTQHAFCVALNLIPEGKMRVGTTTRYAI